eukprot:SAG22_NODE_21971_length_252_cov_1.013072_1_plen_38_part_01
MPYRIHGPVSEFSNLGHGEFRVAWQAEIGQRWSASDRH